MQLWSAPWDGLPCHRAEGLAASVTIHVAVLALLTAVPPGTPIVADSGDVAVTAVAALPDASTSDTTTEADSLVEEAEPPPDFLEIDGLDLDGIEVDIEKIRRQRDTLFPFVTARLPFLDEARERLSARPDAFVNPLKGERRSSKYPPLELSDAERQQVVDRAWSRRTRWQSFSEIAGLLRKHDPHTGDAAGLVRSHLDANLLQPYFDSDARDPRFWVMLGLAADHTSLIGFVGEFVREHPSSRTTTELLFMLDEFAQASRDAMLMLLSSDPGATLQVTRRVDEDAFALADAVYRQYRDWARREGLQQTNAIRARFDDVRTGILRTIIATADAGYGIADAKYLLGLIQWDRNDVDGALKWWRDLAPDQRDAYREVSSAIARELGRTDGSSVAAISGILGAEYRRWLTFSRARLDRFGYSFDTF
jgi:hypothetical protein